MTLWTFFNQISHCQLLLVGVIELPDLPSRFSAIKFQFWGPYWATSSLSLASSAGLQWPLAQSLVCPLFPAPELLPSSSSPNFTDSPFLSAPKYPSPTLFSMEWFKIWNPISEVLESFSKGWPTMNPRGGGGGGGGSIKFIFLYPLKTLPSLFRCCGLIVTEIPDKPTKENERKT